MSSESSGLRKAALIALGAGAAASVALTLYAGRHSPPILVPLFALWVLFPFIGLAFTGLHSRHWPVRTRALLYGAMLVVAVVSPAIYATRAFGPPRPQGAFAFVVVPVAAWLVTAAVFAGGALSARRTAGK